MNISKEQKYSLRVYLDKQLKYREVFDEVYDHVLSALENAPENEDFEAVYHFYINREFGGSDGLHLLERHNRNRIFSAMRQRYFGYLTEQLRFPVVLIWMLLIACAYMLLSAPWFVKEWYWIIYANMAIVSGLLYAIRYIKTGYIMKTKKSSVADEVFNWLKYFQRITLAFFLFSSIFCDAGFMAEFKRLSALTAAVLLVFYSLHISSVLKLYKHEFKAIPAP